YQALARLRVYLKRERIGLFIVEEDGAYSLQANQPLSIRVEAQFAEAGKARYASHVKSALRHPDRENLVKLPKTFDSSEFSAREVAHALKKSHNSAILYLRQWALAGAVAKIGAGPETKYRLQIRQVLCVPQLPDPVA